MKKPKFNFVEHMRKANASMSEDQKVFLGAFEAALDEAFEQRDAATETEFSEKMNLALRSAIGQLPEGEDGKVTTIVDQIRSVAESMEKLEKRTMVTLNATEKFQLRKMLDDNKDKIVEAIREGRDFRMSFQAKRVAAAHLDTNTYTDAGTFIMPDVENFEVETDIARIRYPQNFILDVIPSRMVAKVPQQVIRPEQAPVEGAAALVAEGGLKPLVQFKFVRTTTARKKYAAHIEWSEEFEMDNDMLFAEILRLFEAEVIRKWQDGIIAQIITNATAYTTSVLDGTLINPDNGIAAIASASVIAGLNFTPDTVIMHPSDATALMFTQDSDGNWRLVPYLQNGKINGMNLVLSNKITQGNALIGDSSVYREVHSNFMLRFGYYNDQFIKNMKSAVGEVFSLLRIAEIDKTAWMYIDLDAVKASLTVEVAP